MTNSPHEPRRSAAGANRGAGRKGIRDVTNMDVEFISLTCTRSGCIPGGAHVWGGSCATTHLVHDQGSFDPGPSDNGGLARHAKQELKGDRAAAPA